MKTNVNAKITIKNEAKAFLLSIDWDGLTEEEMRALAQRSIVIAWQNRHRVANEGNGEWPSKNPAIKATDFRLGQRVSVVRDPIQMIEAGEFTAEQLEHFADIIRQKMAAQG